jgi:hypothetical protein
MYVVDVNMLNSGCSVYHARIHGIVGELSVVLISCVDQAGDDEGRTAVTLEFASSFGG